MATANTNGEETSHTAETLVAADDTYEPSETEQLQRRFGRYRLLRKLGKGGMGEVYMAYDEELDRRVAIKVLHPHLGHAPVHQARMQREARALARISHPNVVAMYDVGTLGEGRLFMAMEFVRGQTLSEWQAAHDPNNEADRRALIELYIQAGRGLAAAHQFGLVHRDFKPDNVIVGDDERVRVLDFGLVAPIGDAQANEISEPSLTRANHSPELTAAGTVMGTPMYMAPEQFRGDATDERTDQFNFCASLYRALYGAPAFDGKNLRSLASAAFDGRLREPPTTSRTPEWLNAVVHKGLAQAPDDRHPSMDALLEALARDPIRIRRRRVALALVLLAVAMVSIALVSLTMLAVDHWQTRERENEALERLAALDAALDDPDLATEPRRLAFESFVSQRDNWDTDALALAWLHEAERARASAEDIVAAYAQAYALARADATRTAALRGLARHFRANLRWRGLARALALLDEDPHAEDRSEADIEELRGLELDAALARRDIESGRALLASSDSPRLNTILAQLGRAAPTSHTARDELLAVDVDADGTRELIALRPGELQVFAGDLSLAAREPVDVLGRYHQVIASDRGPLLITSDRIMTELDASLSSLAGGTLVEWLQWPEHVVHSALAHDLDGDGHDEIYVGTSAYTYHLLELVPGAAGAWSTRAVAPIVDRRRSDIAAMAAADLDGDGRSELVLGHGPWQGYSLRVLRRSPGHATLDSVARVRFGDVLGLALLEQPDGVEIIAATKSGSEPAPGFVFDLPHVSEPGLYGFVLRGDQLEPTRQIPLPQLGTDRIAPIAAIRSGDLDGDGRDELIVSHTIEPRGTPFFTVYVFDEEGTSGSYQAFSVADAQILGMTDLDADGDDELLVWLADQQRTWVLGAGDKALPILAVPTPNTEPPALADPALVRVWGRAEELQAMGLGREAAASFATVAAQSPVDDLELSALLRAGELLALEGDDVGAAELYTRAVRAASPPSAEAALAAAQGYRRRGEFEAALAVLDQPFAAHEAREAELDKVRTELELLLSPARDHRLNFDVPLASDWAIHEPTSLRRDAQLGQLHVDANTRRTLLSRGVRDDDGDGLVLLEAELDFTRAGWGSALQLRLVDEVGRAIARIDLSMHGGGAALDYRMHCIIGEGAGMVEHGHTRPAAEGPPGPVTLRLVWDRARDEATCRVSQGTGTQAERELVYRSFDTSGAPVGTIAGLELGSDSATGLHATLHTLRLTGLELLTPEPSTDAIARLVEGDHVGVLEATAASTPEARQGEVRLWRILALARLARLDDASRELLELAEHAQDWDTVEPELIGRVVAEPVLFGPLLALALGHERRLELFVAAWAAWFQDNTHDPHPTRVLHDALAELGPDPRPHQLALRAAVHSRRKHHEAAAADYAQALELVRALEPEGEGESGERKHARIDALRLGLAREMLAGGDEASARALVAELLASPEGVERNAEEIADDARLAPLLGDG